MANLQPLPEIKPSIPTSTVALHNAISDTEQREYVQKMLNELLITITDKVFKDQTVLVDGYRFINCRFEKCNLIIKRGTFEFHHCVVDDASKRSYSDGAQKCVQLFLFKNTIKYTINKGFLPKSYPDGSFSISKDLTGA